MIRPFPLPASDKISLLREKVGSLEGDSRVLKNDLDHIKGDLAQVMQLLEREMDKIEVSLEAHMKDELVQLRELLRQELDRQK